MEVPMTRHAATTIEVKGFSIEAVAEVWAHPDTKYPSHRHPGQHKRIGNGICLCCDDVTGKIITVFVHQENTTLRPDQRTDVAALKWARKNGMG
jgi:hypothetical protein